MRPLLLTLFALGLAAGCGAAPLGPAPAPKRTLTAAVGPGPLFFSGGADDKPGMLLRFRELAGGPAAPIVIVPLAGSPGDGEDYRAAFARLNATDVAVVGFGQAAVPAGLDAIARARGVYVLGGITSALVLRIAPYAAAIRAAWRAGAAVGGHSAGAMICADRVITRGEGPDALAHGLDAEAGGLDVQAGLGLLPAAIVDTHFGERGRFPRLWVATGATARVGIGVDPDTAAVWTRDGTLTAYGAGAVTLIRPETPPTDAAAGARIATAPARVTVLGHGAKAMLGDWRPSAP